MVVGALALVLGIVVYSTNSKDSVAPAEVVVNSKVNDDDAEDDGESRNAPNDDGTDARGNAEKNG